MKDMDPTTEQFYFMCAAVAMKGIIVAHPEHATADREILARTAFDVADAMLAEYERRAAEEK